MKMVGSMNTSGQVESSSITVAGMARITFWPLENVMSVLSVRVGQERPAQVVDAILDVRVRVIVLHTSEVPHAVGTASDAGSLVNDVTILEGHWRGRQV